MCNFKMSFDPWLLFNCVVSHLPPSFCFCGCDKTPSLKVAEGNMSLFSLTIPECSPSFEGSQGRTQGSCDIRATLKSRENSASFLVCSCLGLSQLSHRAQGQPTEMPPIDGLGFPTLLDI